VPWSLAPAALGFHALRPRRAGAAFTCRAWGECPRRVVGGNWPHQSHSTWTLGTTLDRTGIACVRGRRCVNATTTKSEDPSCSFAHASNGPDFDTDLSRIVNLLHLIAFKLAISIWHCLKGLFNQVSCLRLIRVVVVFCDVCGWLCCINSNIWVSARFTLRVTCSSRYYDVRFRRDLYGLLNLPCGSHDPRLRRSTKPDLT
jgi:hypothetical protein